MTGLMSKSFSSGHSGCLDVRQRPGGCRPRLGVFGQRVQQADAYGAPIRRGGYRLGRLSRPDFASPARITRSIAARAVSEPELRILFVRTTFGAQPAKGRRLAHFTGEAAEWLSSATLFAASQPVGKDRRWDPGCFGCHDRKASGPDEGQDALSELRRKRISALGHDASTSLVGNPFSRELLRARAESLVGP